MNENIFKIQYTTPTIGGDRLVNLHFINKKTREIEVYRVWVDEKIAVVSFVEIIIRKGQFESIFPEKKTVQEMQKWIDKHRIRIMLGYYD